VPPRYRTAQRVLDDPRWLYGIAGNTRRWARREAFEEANARLELAELLAVYTVPRLSQVQLIYRATLPDGRYSAGEESLEVGLFAFEDIPWDEIAFPTVHWALQHDLSVETGEAQAPFKNPVGGNTDISKG